MQLVGIEIQDVHKFDFLKSDANKFGSALVAEKLPNVRAEPAQRALGFLL